MNSKQVKEFLRHYKFFIKRLFRAFPEIHFSLPKGEYVKKLILDTINSLDKSRKKNKMKKNKK